MVCASRIREAHTKPRKDVVSLLAGCLPSLHSVSADDGTVSGLMFGSDSPNGRSSTPPEAFEPPLASVEGTTYTPLFRGGLTCQTAAGRSHPALNYMERKKLPEGGQA